MNEVPDDVAGNERFMAKLAEALRADLQANLVTSRVMHRWISCTT